MWMEMEIRRKGITKWVVDHVGSYDHTIMMLSSPGVMDLHHPDQLLNCVNNFVRTSSTIPVYIAFTPHHRVSGTNVLVLPTDLNLLWKQLGLKMKREKTLRFKKMMTSA
uniref:Uncharacterized protein n=1 Tax=Ciona savignyi TaxID=51511 RepID=H2Z7R8_CIOSA